MEQSEQLRKTSMWVFGLAMAAYEIVARHGQDEAVFIFLLACLGFKPAVHLDGLFRSKPEPETPAPAAAKEAVSP